MKNKLINSYATVIIWSVVLAISLYIPSLYIENYENSIYNSRTLMTILFLPELIVTLFLVNAYFKAEKIHRKILMILWILMMFLIPFNIFTMWKMAGNNFFAFCISMFTPFLFLTSGIYFIIFHHLWKGICIFILAAAVIFQTAIFLRI